MNEKIGIGIITCDRESLFQQCISSIPDIGVIIVVNDGKPYSGTISKKVDKYVQHRRSSGVGKSKNEALRYLLESGCEHIFICEDDIAIIDLSVFERYIYAAKVTGMLHLNFAYHGPANKDSQGIPAPKKTIEYNENVSISLHRHLAGAFSYYHADVLRKVGFIDEFYHNVYDHLDHTIEISAAGFYPSFGWFADLANSYSMIRDLDQDLSQSVIRKNFNMFKLRYRLYAYYFRFKHGHFVEKMPIVPEIELTKELVEIKKRNARKEISR